MKGFKVLRSEYSGKVVGDITVYANEDAARWIEAKEKEEASQYARSEEAPEIEFVHVDYEPMAGNQCRVGRVIHDLSRITRSDLVRQNAVNKLTEEERMELGLEAIKS